MQFLVVQKMRMWFQCDTKIYIHITYKNTLAWCCKYPGLLNDLPHILQADIPFVPVRSSIEGHIFT